MSFIVDLQQTFRGQPCKLGTSGWLAGVPALCMVVLESQQGEVVGSVVHQLEVLKGSPGESPGLLCVPLVPSVPPGLLRELRPTEVVPPPGARCLQTLSHRELFLPCHPPRERLLVLQWQSPRGASSAQTQVLAPRYAERGIAWLMKVWERNVGVLALWEPHPSAPHSLPDGHLALSPHHGPTTAAWTPEQDADPAVLTL